MKSMYKNGEHKAVHTYQIDSMISAGWAFKPESQEKTEKLTDTHKQALELGLEIRKEDGSLIHHKTLGKLINEALEDDDQDEGQAS